MCAISQQKLRAGASANSKHYLVYRTYNACITHMEFITYLKQLYNKLEDIRMLLEMWPNKMLILEFARNPCFI